MLSAACSLGGGQVPGDVDHHQLAVVHLMCGAVFHAWSVEELMIRSHLHVFQDQAGTV